MSLSGTSMESLILLICEISSTDRLMSSWFFAICPAKLQLIVQIFGQGKPKTTLQILFLLLETKQMPKRDLMRRKQQKKNHARILKPVQKLEMELNRSYKESLHKLNDSCFHLQLQEHQIVMGGHGGLNILPQKKWNVYNYDNRAIVDKDKKEAAAKKRAEYQRRRSGGLQGKIDVLLEQKGIRKIDDEAVEQKESLLVQELRKMGEKNKHINLFEREQQIIENREVQELKRLQEAQFLKGKDTMDLSSKFLGTYAEDKSKPWYAKEKGTHKTHKKSKNFLFQSQGKNDRSNFKDEQEDRERSREKKQKSQDKDEGHDEKSQMQRMREKRLRREEKERQKIKRLKQMQGK